MPLLLLIAASCKYKQPDRKNISFKNVIGINYTEVKRRLYTGRSFNSDGYEVNPEWQMRFLSKDSSSIFSPDSNRFLTFPVMLDHDSLFFTGNTWFRAKKVTKDSMIFQVMDVKSKVIYLLHSNVYMTFYANDYIKKHNLNIASLQKTDKLDTAFVKERSEFANKFPADTLFSAREPVAMKSKSPLVIVEKEKVVGNKENHFDTSDAYMYPKYTITFHHAYKDFSYLFTAYVDSDGNIHFLKNLIGSMMGDDYDKSVVTTIKAIIDGYMKTYVTVTPGNTLGVVHTTKVTIDLEGRKN